MKKVLTLGICLISLALSAQNNTVDAGKVNLKTVSGDGFNYTLTTTDGKEQSSYTKDFFKEYGGKYSSSKSGEFTIENLEMLAVSPKPIKAVGQCKDKGEGNFSCGIIFLEGIRNITPNDPGFASAKNIMDVFVKQTNSAALTMRTEEAEKVMDEAKKALEKTEKEIEKEEKSISDLEKELEETKKSLAKNKQLKTEQQQVVNEGTAKFDSLNKRLNSN